MGDKSNCEADELKALENENVRELLGETSENAIILSSDVVLPSFREASSLVVLESLILQRPVHLRKSIAEIYMKWCVVSKSEIGIEYIKLIKPKERDYFVSHFSTRRGIAEYLEAYRNDR